jgi:CheY-like chemotaxis protein
MTSAIDATADLPVVPHDPAASRRDAGKLMDNVKRGAGSGAPNAADQINWRASTPGRKAGSTIKPLRALIVEDDREIGPLLAETIEQLGHVVCAVEVDAAAAADVARRCRPDLMIIDIGFGETMGIAVVQEILEQGFVRHLFVTGDGLRNPTLGRGVVLIQKPYRTSDLITAIARAVDERAQLEESDSSRERDETARRLTVS